jgi:hypothetical protein
MNESINLVDYCNRNDAMRHHETTHGRQSSIRQSIINDGLTERGQTEHLATLRSPMIIRKSTFKFISINNIVLL